MCNPAVVNGTPELLEKFGAALVSLIVYCVSGTPTLLFPIENLKRGVPEESDSVTMFVIEAPALTRHRFWKSSEMLWPTASAPKLRVALRPPAVTLPMAKALAVPGVLTPTLGAPQPLSLPAVESPMK